MPFREVAHGGHVPQHYSDSTQELLGNVIASKATEIIAGLKLSAVSILRGHPLTVMRPMASNAKRFIKGAKSMGFSVLATPSKILPKSSRHGSNSCPYRWTASFR